jgi:outer membrane assembly lipoprotein YfiO
LSTDTTARLSLRAAAGAALLLLLGAVGCSLHNPYPVGSFERGAYYAERGNNVEAVAALESFVRHNPTDSLAAEAQYIKGTTYMQMEEYPLAAVEFQILRKDYPTSERVEDAFFQEGLAYYLQVGRIERDMTGAYDARSHFLRFLETYPRSPHVQEIHGILQEISDLLVQKRLEQIKVFRQLKRHEAVAVVLDETIAQEPGTSLMDRLLWERAQAARKLKDWETAEEIYERLIFDFPESDLAGKAKGALEAVRRQAAEADDEG